mmetsp:Transcript_80951/g.219263  ORF Transcript_80951/g.219263 Transcript_80951/m.219263 type:complete len:222 (+) Transcript_80951:878-1543(+)
MPQPSRPRWRPRSAPPSRTRPAPPRAETPRGAGACGPTGARPGRRTPGGSTTPPRRRPRAAPGRTPGRGASSGMLAPCSLQTLHTSRSSSAGARSRGRSWRTAPRRAWSTGRPPRPSHCCTCTPSRRRHHSPGSTPPSCCTSHRSARRGTPLQGLARRRGRRSRPSPSPDPTPRQPQLVPWARSAGPWMGAPRVGPSEPPTLPSPARRRSPSSPCTSSTCT